MEKEDTQTPTDKVQLNPYHPDTPTFRYTHARYHDRQTVIDGQIGAVVEKLEKDGLLEDTFIFVFGDHGGVLPRSKGYAYESGLHVPLVVRIPENFQHLAKHERGSRTNGFVSFIDFGPTVLNLAGIPVPKVLDGTPFLGENICPNELAKRDTTFGYADRFDEKYDLVRTIRKGKYKYNRNYQGYYPDGLQNNYRYRMLAFEEWRQLYKQGNKLTDAQKQFFLTRPPEQLFDIENDPHEIHDLSKDPKHQQKLLELRGLLSQKVKAINDLSFYPENYMVNHTLNDGINYGVQHTKEIAKQARRLLNDKDNMVANRAAEYLGSLNEDNVLPTLYRIVNETESTQEQMIATNTLVYLRDFKGYTIDLEKLPKTGLGEANRRIQYLRGQL